MPRCPKTYTKILKTLADLRLTWLHESRECSCYLVNIIFKLDLACCRPLSLSSSISYTPIRRCSTCFDFSRQVQIHSSYVRFTESRSESRENWPCELEPLPFPSQSDLLTMTFIHYFTLCNPLSCQTPPSHYINIIRKDRCFC